MSKRYEPMKDYGRSTKKPKLEIVVNKGQNVKNFQTLQRHADTNAQVKIAPQGSSDGLWDDDDDDVILLASQVVENIVANENTEITFSEFAPGLQYATSTQKLANSSLQNYVGKSWDDEVFPNPNSIKKTEIFKVPTTATSSIAHAAETKKTTLALISSQKSNENSAPAPQSRKEKAFEGKIQFLEKSLNKIKEENTKLTTDLEETKTKMISKEGEVTVLRDEIRHLKKQIQDIRVEKIHITEEAKTQCKSKIAELSKEVEAKKTALELKSIECNKMKMRHADETMRLEMSIRENCNEIKANHPRVSDERHFSIQQLRSLQRLANLSLNDPVPTQHETSKTTTIPKEIFEQSKERGTSKIRKTLFQIELENLQIIAAQYRSSGVKKHNSSIDNSTDVLDKTLASVRKVFPEFWTYVHSLEFSKSLHNRRHKPHRLEPTSDDKCNSMRKNLFQPTELYEQEKAVNLRRYVALLSILCYTLPELPIVLLSERHEEYFLIQIITDAIAKLSFSRECDQHFGLLEAFSAFLHSLLTHTIHDEKYYEQLIGMLKTLVFCQPSEWVFLEISRCFLTLAEASEQACCRLCVNSPTEQQFTINQNRECEISSNSCVLQVYCALLEWSFPFYKELLSIKQFELLTTICGNYVRFVSCLLTHPVKFVQDMIPYDDQNDDEVGEQIENTCECYVKMCKTTVTLLCTVLYYWQKTDTTPEFTKQIEQISKIGVKLMFRIFCQNSTTRIFRSGEDTTRHYFDMICKWWSKYADELHFSNYDNVFLQKLLTSPFVAVKLAMLGSRTVCKSDLEQWYICSTDDTCSATKEPIVDGKNAAKNLRILEDAVDPKNFFDRLLQRKTCNFE